MSSKVVLSPEAVKAKIARLTGRAVARMIRALSGMTMLPGLPDMPARDRRSYDEFRRQKRKIYALYPDDSRKAQAIVKFAIVRSGWSSK